MKTIDSFGVKQKSVIIRADLNVPVVDGIVIDKSRIISLKSSIKKLRKNKNKIFIISHFGRPKGKPNKKLSLNFLCQILANEFGVDKIHFLDNFETSSIDKLKKNMKFGDISLFENIRFFQGEENNDPNFSKKISNCFDVYINDAFSASHRTHASIVGITNYLPSLAGDKLVDEIKNLDLLFNNSKNPNTAIIGGSKISTKINLLNNLLECFDNIVIGGAMANTFLAAKGLEVGRSLIENKFIDNAKEILKKANNVNCNLILPVDVVCSNNIKDLENIRYCKVENILPDQIIFDIGDKSIQEINKIILKSNTILWNGPLGAFEHKPFDNGTMELANIINKHSKILNITTLAGGGDTIAAIKMAKAQNAFSYISDAGGAFVEWLEGNQSPGVIALNQNKIN